MLHSCQNSSSQFMVVKCALLGKKSDRNMNMVDFKLLNKYQYLLHNLIYLLSKNPFGLKQYTLQTNKKTIKEIYYIFVTACAKRWSGVVKWSLEDSKLECSSGFRGCLLYHFATFQLS
jgi:hypothetical protein